MAQIMAQMLTRYLVDLYRKVSGRITASRLGPIKTSLNKLSKALGYTSADQVPLEAFNLPLNSLYKKIDRYFAKLPPEERISNKAITNVKNDVSYLLRLGWESDPPLLPLPTGDGRLTRKKVRKRDLRRGEQVIAPSYRLREEAPTFTGEMAMYEEWCGANTSFDRPATLKRKVITINSARGSLLRYAGYLVMSKRLLATSLTLAALVIPENVAAYVNWYIKQRGGKLTSTVILYLSKVQSLLKYLIITCGVPEQVELYKQYAEKLKTYKQNLGRPVPVHNKKTRQVSLKQLEQVGISCYPEVALTLQALPLEELRKQSVSLLFFRDVMYSLLLRILVRIPMRQRNIREMQWNPEHPELGKNLYRKGHKWYFQYAGQEIKIAENARQPDGVNRYEHEVPGELIPLLEDWLFRWRPLLLAQQSEAAKGSEKTLNDEPLLPGQELVFLTSVGTPLAAENIIYNFKTITYAFLGVAVNPHMVRTIWATDYIKAERDIMGAALMLGDKAETVMKHYAHLLEQDLRDRVKGFLVRALSD